MSKLKNHRRQAQAKLVREKRVAQAIFIAGLLALFFSAAFLSFSEQSLVTWLHRDEYVATELEVDHVQDSEDSRSYVYGRIVTDDTALRMTPAPANLYFGPHVPLSLEQLKGRRVPIWYAATARGIFSEPRVEYRGKGASFDVGPYPLGAVAIEAITSLAGVLLMMMGWKRLRRWEAKATFEGKPLLAEL